MNFKNILSLLLVITMLYSCGKDEGNYDYNLLGDVEVTNVLSDEIIGVVFGEALELNADVVTDIDESYLSYAWYIDRLIRKDTIGYEKNLNVIADFEGGRLFLAIRHIESQVEWRFETELNVQLIYQKGWAILSNTSDGVDLNFLSGVKTGSDGNIVYEYYPEAYKSANGESLPASTKDLVKAHRDNFWMLHTENDAICVNMNTMERSQLLSDYFSTTAYLNGPLNPEYIGFSNSEGQAQIRMVSTGGDLFVASNVNEQEPASFSAPIEGEHYLGKHLAGFSGEYVAYDEADKRYLWINCNGGRIQPIVPSHAGGSDVTINIGDLNMECKMLGKLSWNKGYAVLKDESGNFHMHVFTPEYVTLNFTRNIQIDSGVITDKSIITHVNIDNQESGNIYIATGSSIHLYNVENNTFTYDWRVFESEVLALQTYSDWNGAEMVVAVKNGVNSKFHLMDLAQMPADMIVETIDVEGHIVSCDKRPW